MFAGFQCAERLRPAGLQVQRLIEKGCSLWDDENDASGAEQCFLKAIELNPKNEEALCSYGVLLHESSNNYQEATKVCGSSPLPVLLSLVAEMVLESLQYFEMALSSNPSHVDSLHFYGERQVT